MFKAKTQKIELLAQMFPERITELEALFCVPTKVYIDLANVRPWSTKLGWNVEIQRVRQFLLSFSQIKDVRLYNGVLEGNKQSEKMDKEYHKNFGRSYITKPVKIMKKSIDASSISADSPDLLKDFIRSSLLRKLKIETIEYLNRRLLDLNREGILYIEDRKCNFDVEIGRDILIDDERGECECFVLWSGDSDFASPIEQLLQEGKKVCIFATARRIASELNDLVPYGLHIYDIQKIKNFICWPTEMDGAQ